MESYIVNSKVSEQIFMKFVSYKLKEYKCTSLRNKGTPKVKKAANVSTISQTQK